ncbi:MAG: tyrosine-type recombinase/integrase, partial [Candidatus Dormibacteria bacterium]
MGETAIARRHFPHRFRHSFATNALCQVRDIEVVQELLDHTDIDTTGQYLPATMADKRAAAPREASAAGHATQLFEEPGGARPKSRGTGAPQGQPGWGPSSELVDQAEAAIARALRATQLLPGETVSRLTSPPTRGGGHRNAGRRPVEQRPDHGAVS